jgi:hypothetical protein
MTYTNSHKGQKLLLLFFCCILYKKRIQREKFFSYLDKNLQILYSNKKGEKKI